MAASDAYVMVGCKMPTGITLELEQSVWDNKDAPGMVPVTHVEPSELGKVFLRGTAHRRGIDSPPVLIDGYRFTPVPKAFWEAFDATLGLKTKRPFGPLKDGYIIVAPNQDAAEKMSRERENEPGKDDPLVENDPRTRVLKSKGVTAPEAADEHKAKFAA